MSAITFATSYPLAVAFMSTYGPGRGRRRPMWDASLPEELQLPQPPFDMQLPNPLKAIRLMLGRLNQPQEVTAALWWYFVADKSISQIASAMFYTDRHVYRLLARGLKAMESLLSAQLSITHEMIAQQGKEKEQPVDTAQLPPWM